MKKLLLLICLLLCSCSTMKPEECVNANWNNIGYNDALQGRTVRLKSRTKACAKVNLKPNKKAYLAGYKVGSKKFCTFKNGFLYGRRGRTRDNICITPELAKPFYDGYNTGLDVYQRERYLEERMYRMHRRLHHMHHQHQNLKKS